VYLRIKPLFSWWKTSNFYPRSLNVKTSYHPELTYINIAPGPYISRAPILVEPPRRHGITEKLLLSLYIQVQVPVQCTVSGGKVRR